MQTSIKTAQFMLVSSAVLVALAVTTSSPAFAQQQLDVPAGATASLNWSGYVAQKQGNYTAVTGTWIVPEVSANTSGTADAAWVGIGGVSARDLIQAGTQALVENGQVSYSAWIETLPGFSKPVPLAVSSGDSVTATVSEETPGTWKVTLHNNTTGAEYSTEVAYDSSHSSAEWVEEMVSNPDGTFRPLDRFGSVSFLNASATLDGTAQNLSVLDAQPLQMVTANGDMLSSVSALGGDNQSFTVSRSSAEAVATDSQTQPKEVRVARRHHGSYHTYTFDGIPGFTITIGGY